MPVEKLAKPVSRDKIPMQGDCALPDEKLRYNVQPRFRVSAKRGKAEPVGRPKTENALQLHDWRSTRKFADPCLRLHESPLLSLSIPGISNFSNTSRFASNSTIFFTKHVWDNKQRTMNKKPPSSRNSIGLIFEHRLFLIALYPHTISDAFFLVTIFLVSSPMTFCGRKFGCISLLLFRGWTVLMSSTVELSLLKFAPEQECTKTMSKARTKCSKWSSGRRFRLGKNKGIKTAAAQYKLGVLLAKPNSDQF